MSSVSVSIVIPTRDRAETLPETIASVQEQSFKALEVVVVDDGSTDETASVVGALRSSDPRIRWVQQTEGKRGAPAARNTGLGKSRGEFVLFLDSDDLLLPGCLARRVQALEDQPDAGFSASLCVQFRDEIDPAAEPDRHWNSEPDISRFLRFDHAWHTGGVLWRRETLGAIGGWDERLGYFQDWELSLRALAHGIQYERLEGADWGLRRDDRPRISGRGYRPTIETIALIDAVAELKKTVVNGSAVADYIPSICMTLTRRHALAGQVTDALRVWRYCWSQGHIESISALATIPLFLVSPWRRWQKPFQWFATAFSGNSFRQLSYAAQVNKQKQ